LEPDLIPSGFSALVMRIDLAEADATTDRCFEALADDSRRHVLSTLCRAETPLSLSELAVDLVNTGNTPAGPGVEDDPVRSRKVELYHRHVPKLAEAGFVEFDADRRTVTLAAEFEGADDPSELLAA
jgi:hypothetical protein